MKTLLSLDSVQALPFEIIARLSDHEHLFREHEFLESVLDHSPIRIIAEDLNAYLKQQRIYGYHCTKEPRPNYFETHGLRLTDVRAHQAEFLEMFAARFTADEVLQMKAAWKKYFHEEGQLKYRDGRIWACLSRSLVSSYGTNTFFRYFGGEAIFMPLVHHSDIAKKLEAIGQPVVVEVALPGAKLNASYEMSFAVLSQYHIKLRPDARPYESAAYLCQAITKEDVVQVTPLSEFSA